MSVRSSSLVALVGIALTSTSAGQPAAELRANALVKNSGPVLVTPTGPQEVVLPDGTQAILEGATQSRLMCGSDGTGMTVDDLRRFNDVHELQMQAEDVIVIDTPRRGGGIDVIFNLAGSVPANAVASFQMAEQAIESYFLDNSTIVVSASFQNFGNGGVIGATSSNTLNRNYSIVRSELINDMDADDTVQSLLPTGSTLSVRFSAGSSNVSQVSSISVHRSAFKAVGGSSGGNDASMSFNTLFNFDFDPTNGVPGNQTSLVDVIIHEVGHGMGFVSSSDFGGNLNSLDMFRFQRTDGTGDYNPDNAGEFTARPRLRDVPPVSGVGPDDAVVDFVDVEYRMEDGADFQASHFDESFNNIGIMDPAISSGQTFVGRGYYTAADLAAFDAIGFDFIDTAIPVIVSQPAGGSVCEGEDFTTLSVQAAGSGLVYQWFKDGVPLIGAINPDLLLLDTDPSDAGMYFVNVSNGNGDVDSNTVEVMIDPAPSFITDVADVTVAEGEEAVFTFDLNGNVNFVTWLFNGLPIGGQNGDTLSIPGVTPALDGATVQAVVDSDCGSVNSRIATLTVSDEQEPCLADVNMNGSVEPTDFGAWLAAFNADDPAADQNQNGSVEPTDFGAWLANFNAGCD